MRQKSKKKTNTKLRCHDFSSGLADYYRDNHGYLPRFTADDFPEYLRSKKVIKESAGLPDGIKWNTTTKIMFNHCKTLEKVLEWRSENKKPIYITVEGESGEGKTNVLIWLLSWMLKKFKGIELNTENFYKYFYLKQSLNLDTRIITKKHQPKDTICVDEFHLIMPHHASTQNRQVIKFVDTVREYPLYLIGATPSAMSLDSKYFSFRNVIQIIVDYTSIKREWTKFDVLVNALGVNSKGERNWQYLFLELDRRIPFQPKELWLLSRKAKFDNVYGRSTDAFETFADKVRMDTQNEKKDNLKKDINKALSEAVDVDDAVIKLLNVKSKVGRRLTYKTIEVLVKNTYPESKTNWRTVKTIETKLFTSAEVE